MTMIGHNGGPRLTEPSLDMLYRDMEYSRRMRRYVSHCPKIWRQWNERLELAEAAYKAALERSYHSR